MTPRPAPARPAPARPARSVRFALAGGLLLAPVLATHARAQDETRQQIALENEILELRHDVDTLRAQVAAGGGATSPQPQAPAPQPPGDAAAALLDRVSALEDQARTLQGGLDEVRNGLQRQNADLSKQISDLAFRVQTLEGGKPAEPGAPADAAAPPLSPPPHLLGTQAAPAPAPAPAPASARASAPVTNHLTLQQGYAALARRDYPAAEAAARATLATPHAPRAADAQFLLAQSLAGQRNYQQAALAYDDAYTRQRKGPHAPDALLGLAASLAALGEKPAACATLDKLRGEFPAPRPDLRASSTAISRRASCH